MADTTTAPAAKANGSETKQQFVKPEKPDETVYKDQLYKLEKAHSESQAKFNTAKAKLDNSRPNNKDSPNAIRQQELKSQLSDIRKTQQGQKSSRTAVLDKVKRLDEQLKGRIAELKTSKGKINFKSVEDVDREIARLQKEVDTGRMKIVDEKKALNEISNLNKARKNFSGFDAQQKAIDDIKAQIAEQKKLLDDPEQKALSQRYTELQNELDGLKAEQDGAFKNLKVLIEARDKARDDQQAKFQAIKEHKDQYYQQKRAYADYDYQARKARNERKRQEQLEYQANKRKETAAKRLEEASAPAYQDEILASEGLIRYFDPSALPAKETTTASKFAASAQRTVDDSGLKGTRLAKKGDEEENYFVGTGGKKGKKNRKTAAPAENKFSLSIGVLDELAKVGVNPPSSQADVPATVEKLKEKLEKWKSEQDAKTKENIAKAQKEIDRLEAEEAEGVTDTARKPAAKNQAVNGGPVSAEAELQQEKAAEVDAADELAKAKIEDSEAPES